VFDNDADGKISKGDDFVLDVNQNGFYDAGIDSIILDENEDLVDGEPAACSLTAVGDLLKAFYYDANGNGQYDLGEDIVIDVLDNDIFEGSGLTLP
jgi:hypothetical protein